MNKLSLLVLTGLLLITFPKPSFSSEKDNVKDYFVGVDYHIYIYNEMKQTNLKIHLDAYKEHWNKNWYPRIIYNDKFYGQDFAELKPGEYVEVLAYHCNKPPVARKWSFQIHMIPWHPSEDVKGYPLIVSPHRPKDNFYPEYLWDDCFSTYSSLGKVVVTPAALTNHTNYDDPFHWEKIIKAMKNIKKPTWFNALKLAIQAGMITIGKKGGFDYTGGGVKVGNACYEASVTSENEIIVPNKFINNSRVTNINESHIQKNL